MAQLAMKRIRENVPFYTAMLTACEDIFNGGTPATPKTDSKGNNMCTHAGYGANYPGIIFEHYQKACQAMGGDYTSGVVV